MIDPLATCSDEDLLAKGRYAVIRAAHEDAKRRLVMLLGEAMQQLALVAKLAQESDEAALQQAGKIVARLSGERMVDALGLVQDILVLAERRAELKAIAWPKPATKQKE